jgi:glycosyltransferase involved in cell wall biosynthesis
VSIDQIIVPMMVIAAIAGGFMTLAHIAGVFMYDMRSAKLKQAYAKHPHAQKYRARPLITVVVSAYNDVDSIMYTLNSILKSNYKKLEILVVDLGSEDMSKALVKGYIEQHPKQSIRLITQKEQEGGKHTLRRAVKHYGSGDIVLSIPAGGYVEPTALKNAVLHFAQDENLDALNTNRFIESRASVIGLFERYVALVAQRSDKFLSEAGLLVTVRRMTLYRRGVYLRIHRPHLKLRYAQDVRVGVPALASYRKIFGRNYRAYVHVLRTASTNGRSWLAIGYICCSLLLTLTGPLLIGYFLYVALYLHESTLLLLCIVGMSAFLAIAINEEGRLNIWQKAGYVLGLPVIFALFYVLSLARLLAVIGAPFYRRPADA